MLVLSIALTANGFITVDHFNKQPWIFNKQLIHHSERWLTGNNQEEDQALLNEVTGNCN